MIHSQVNQICIWKTPDPSEQILEDMFHLARKKKKILQVFNKNAIQFNQ